MGRGFLRGAGGDENLKFNFIWPNHGIIQKAPTFYHAFYKIIFPLPEPQVQGWEQNGRTVLSTNW